MKFLAIIFCIATLNLCAQEDDSEMQVNELKKLCAIKYIPASEITDFCSDFSQQQGEALENYEILLSSVFEESFEVAKSLSEKITTYDVKVIKQGEFTYHTALYPNGVGIGTCLNGPKKGTQIITLYGTIMMQSSNVEWCNTHFVHFYEHSIVTSYNNKQIIESK